jgi:hypothetical protein
MEQEAEQVTTQAVDGCSVHAAKARSLATSDKPRLPGAVRTGGVAPHRRASWTKAAVVLGVVLAASFGESALAQRDGPQISVAPTILAEPATQAALSIQVGPPGALPGNSFIRLRGLPASVSLTEGYAIAPGSWAVPLFGLPSLKAVVPAGVTGRAEIIVHLVAVDGTTLAEARTALIVGPATMIAPPDRVAAEPPPRRPALLPAPQPTVKAAQPQPPELAAGERERAGKLLGVGDRHLEQGNISAARMFFQRAAEAGLAAGAIKMAATFDPVELERLGVKVQGTIADRAEARKWYERARTLGSPEAEERLARIGGS